MEIKNALITGTFLGYEDHGIFTFWINVDISGGGHVGIGGYALDEFDKEKNRRVFRAETAESIAYILETVGVDSWEELKGTYIRIEDNGWGSQVNKIGNLMDEKWFNLKAFFVNVQKDT